MNRALLLLLLAGCEIGPAIYVERAGDGDGEITSDPSGLHCGDDCAMIVDDGVITLTATARAGSRFAGWDVAGCEGPQCVVRLAGDAHVSARFEPVFHTIAVTRVGAGGGSVVASINDVIACGELCESRVREGTKFVLIPQPDLESVFVGWRGTCADLGPCNVVMDDSFAIEAEFQPKPKLSVTVFGGRVYSDVPGIDCGMMCSYAFPKGTYVTLRPVLMPGWAVEWEGPCQVLPMGCLVTIDGAQAVTARFTKSCVPVMQSEPASTFNTRLTIDNTELCLYDGVTIAGHVVFGANNITIRRKSPTDVVRFENPNGTAIDVGVRTGIRLDGLDIRANGPQFTYIVVAGSGASLALVNSTVTCQDTACYMLFVLNAALAMTNTTLVGGSSDFTIGVFAESMSTVQITASTITAKGHALYAVAGPQVTVTDSTLTGGMFSVPIAVNSGAALDLITSTVRAGGFAISAGGPGAAPAVRLQGNTIRKLAGSSTSSSPITSDRDHSVFHSMLANTFCNEGTSTTDGEFVLPLISGPYAASSTFDSIAHNVQGNCP